MKRILTLVAAASFVVGGVCGVASAQETKPAEPAKVQPTPTETTRPAAQPDTAKKDTQPANGGDKKDASMEKLVYVKMATSMGDVFLELNAEKAPISVKNVLSYVDKKFYDNTIFHRVIGNFMVQGGGFTDDLKQKPVDAPIRNEWQNGLKNVKGSLAMARTPVHDSATSQFFINIVDNTFLDQPRDGAGYAVFGRVVGGMDVVDKIKAVKTGTKGGMQDVPVTPVMIKSMTRSTAEEATKGTSAAGSEKK